MTLSVKERGLGDNSFAISEKNVHEIECNRINEGSESFNGD